MVGGLLTVQIQKVATVMRQQYPVLSGGERQDLGIGHRSIGPSGVQRSEDIMAQAPKFVNNLRRNVLVGIEASH